MGKKLTFDELQKLSAEAGGLERLTGDAAKECFSLKSKEEKRHHVVPFESNSNVRVAVMYRVLRYMARCANQLGRDEPLAGLLFRMYGGDRMNLAPSGMADPTLHQGAAMVVLLREKSLGIMPSQGTQDELRWFREVYSTAARGLGIPIQSLQRAVLNDFTSELRWKESLPTIQELLHYEHQLLETVYEGILDGGQRYARQQLVEKLGIGPIEAQEMVSTARFAMTVGIELDQETERKIQSERLERIAQDARNSLDSRLELAAIKERSRLLGLTDRPPESFAKDVFDVIGKVSREAPGGMIDAPGDDADDAEFS